uniref:Uncharacterized protein n=1 Tax=Romanomermis culicivorax TaxID=13658 RepID=A0A915L0R3_ROMCU
MSEISKKELMTVEERTVKNISFVEKLRFLNLKKHGQESKFLGPSSFFHDRKYEVPMCTTLMTEYRKNGTRLQTRIRVHLSNSH